MNRKPRHILAYWNPKLTREMRGLHTRLEVMARVSKTIVSPGDVVWVCTRLHKTGELFLLGRMLVGECRREGGRRELIAKRGTAEPLQAVNLMDVYQEFRFDSSKNYSDRLILRGGRINPEQFGSSRILTDETAELLNSMWYGGQAAEDFEEALEKDILYAAADEAGYGDPITNDEVESEAVSLVTKWYEDYGWVVTNVERENRGYDLICSKGRSEEHVEVKGTQGCTPSYFMTANEYNCAQEDPLFVLCVITGVFSKRPSVHTYAGAELSDEFEFTCLKYKAVPRK
jgi:hypothetical protein